MIRLGLCCIFHEEPIRFRRTTAKYLSRFSRLEQLSRLSEICRHNAESLQQALQFCRENAIGCFRVNSQILPLKTHPEVGYDITDFPGGHEIRRMFLDCGEFVRRHDIRLVFHPDQFILLSSPKETVTGNAIAELSYHGEVAEWIGADVINIHGGGAYGDKSAALNRLVYQIEHLPAPIRTRLTIENDDRVYTPDDLLPVCEKTGIPLVYDVHHHRCLPDGKSVAEITTAAMKTWDREPLFHLSSPLGGWGQSNPRRHHDTITIADFPECWKDLTVTVEVEAKAKELAVRKLMRELRETWGVPLQTADRRG